MVWLYVLFGTSRRLRHGSRVLAGTRFGLNFHVQLSLTLSSSPPHFQFHCTLILRILRPHGTYDHYIHIHNDLQDCLPFPPLARDFGPVMFFCTSADPAGGRGANTDLRCGNPTINRDSVLHSCRFSERLLFPTAAYCREQRSTDHARGISLPCAYHCHVRRSFSARDTCHYPRRDNSL